jgi:lambda family phage portal protein
MPQLNILEKAISKISPKFGVKRLADKCKLVEFNRFAAAYPMKDRMPSRPLSGGEGFSSTFERIELIKAARDLEDNNPIIRSILLKFSQYALGNFRYMSRTGNREIDTMYEHYWMSWCKKADFFGRHNFHALSHLALRSTLRDGDVGFVITRENSIDGMPDPNSDLKLQAVEADRIGGNFDNPTSSQGYIGGVVFDENGRNIAYRVYRRTQGNAYLDPQDIPSQSFILVYDPLRLDEVRGRSHLASIINYCKDLQETLDAENMAVKNAAFRVMTITNSTGQADDPASYFNQAETDAYGNLMNMESMQKSQINYLPTGADMKMFESGRPSNAFHGYVDMIVHMIALAFNLPFGFCYDLAKLGGPTVRLEMALASRTFKRWQSILEDRFFDRVKNIVIADGISRGLIPPSSHFSRGKWIYPSDPTIDVGRDSQANIQMFKAGLMTAAEAYGTKGEDYEEAMRQRAYEVRYAKDLAEEFQIGVDSISEAFKPEPPKMPEMPQLPQMPEGSEQAPEGGESDETDEQPEETEEPMELGVPARARRTSKKNSFTLQDAEMILDAIEMQSIDDIDLSPSDGMVESAKSALRVRAEKPASERGMTQVGIARARDIIGRKRLSPRTWRRMKAFFDRHEVDKKGSTWDQKGKGWQAWMGWGGDAGYTRAKKIVEQLNKIRSGE